MLVKDEKGLTGVDITISIIVMTIFMAMIANLIVNIKLNTQDIKRKSTATSYAVQEIEKIKAQGYINDYDSMGINSKEKLKDEDIYNNSEFSGYHKKVTIKDYVLVINNNTKTKDIVKEITVEISYKLGSKDKKIVISTYVSKENDDEK